MERVREDCLENRLELKPLVNQYDDAEAEQDGECVPHVPAKVF